MKPATILSLMALLATAAPTVWARNGATSKRFEPRDSYGLLARAIQSRLSDDDVGSPPEIARIVKALKSLSATQKTFKGLDGAAHEAYQRTHAPTDVQLGVAGRATRSAARAGATAKALGACELCELVVNPQDVVSQQTFSSNGTLVDREVLLNLTDVAKVGGSPVSCLVLYEPSFDGPCGRYYGSIESGNVGKSGKGQLLIALGDRMELEEMFELLERHPKHVSLNRGPEAASIQPSLHEGASEILRRIDPIIRRYNSSAIHFTGHSMAGGLASIAAAILNGEVPIAKVSGRKRKPTRKSTSSTTNMVDEQSLQGLGRDRTSAVVLGSPPCFSSNVEASYITSIMYGDDIVCRTSPLSFERFMERTKRAVKRSGLIGKRLNFMADAVSLATTNLKSHAIGSEGEETRLSVPGTAFLVRPRRIGGKCSIHEIGNQLKGGRALRAAVLWQLNDMLLSRSLWRHHQLESYIRGLDRVQLRGVKDDEE